MDVASLVVRSCGSDFMALVLLAGQLGEAPAYLLDRGLTELDVH
jgi:hypothetical protein